MVFMVAWCLFSNDNIEAMSPLCIHGAKLLRLRCLGDEGIL